MIWLIGVLFGWIFTRFIAGVMAPGGNLGGDLPNYPPVKAITFAGLDNSPVNFSGNFPARTLPQGGIMRLSDGTLAIIPGPAAAIAFGVEGSNIYLYMNNSFVSIGSAANPVLRLNALIANGGGAAPTFGTIGGSGPTTAAQAGWQKIQDNAGTVRFIPVWS